MRAAVSGLFAQAAPTSLRWRLSSVLSLLGNVMYWAARYNIVLLRPACLSRCGPLRCRSRRCRRGGRLVAWLTRTY